MFLLYLGIFLLYTLGKNIGENIVKLNLEQNIKSLLYNHLVYIDAEETDFWQLYDKPAR